MTIRITTLSITSYAGISLLETDVPERGFIIEGGNERGKTTILNGLKAALEGKGIDASAIKNGAEVAEIRVGLMTDNGETSVRRRITAKGSTIDVAVGQMDAKKPAAFLANLLGATLDPLELVTVDAKKRRALVLAALPVTVTQEQLAEWVPGIGTVDTKGHGLEVVERERKRFYDARAEAKKALAAAATEATRLAAEADTLIGKAPKAALSVADAERDLAGAKATVARLEAQNVEATRAAERGADARKRIAELDEQAAESAALAQSTRPTPEYLAEASNAVATAKAWVATKEQELAVAKSQLLAACDVLATREQATHQARSHDDAAETARRNAAELRATIAAVAVAPVPEAELSEAMGALTAAGVAVEQATAAKAAADAAGRARVAHEAAASAKAAVGKLEAIVDTLTTTAPQALIDGSSGITGLSIVDDDIALDGVRWAALSTSRKMRVALDIARRVSKSSIYFVDCLESIDEERREEFVRMATENGGQIFATRVTRGDIQLIAVEASADTSKAAE